MVIKLRYRDMGAEGRGISTAMDERFGRLCDLNAALALAAVGLSMMPNQDILSLDDIDLFGGLSLIAHRGHSQTTGGASLVRFI